MQIKKQIYDFLNEGFSAEGYSRNRTNAKVIVFRKQIPFFPVKLLLSVH